MNNPWKEAIKTGLKIQLPSSGQFITVAQLFKRPTTGVDSLDEIYAHYSKVGEQEHRLVSAPSRNPKVKQAQLIVQLVKDVYEDRVAENIKAQKRKAAKEKLAQLMELRKAAEIKKLAEGPLDALDKQIAELQAVLAED